MTSSAPTFNSQSLVSSEYEFEKLLQEINRNHPQHV